MVPFHFDQPNDVSKFMAQPVLSTYYAHQSKATETSSEFL